MNFLKLNDHFLVIVLAVILFSSSLVHFTFNTVDAQTPSLEITHNCVNGVAFGSIILNGFPEGNVKIINDLIQPGAILGIVFVPNSGTATFIPEFIPERPITWTAFSDANNNGKLDSGEVFASTTTRINCDNPEPPISPTQQIQNLINMINNLNLEHNLVNSLTAQLNQAVNHLQDNDPSNDVSVCNQLNTLIKKVNAQESANTLTQQQASQIKQQSQLIKDSIGCP